MAVAGCPCVATRPRAAEPSTTTDVRRHLAQVRGGLLHRNADGTRARLEAHRTWQCGPSIGPTTGILGVSQVAGRRHDRHVAGVPSRATLAEATWLTARGERSGPGSGNSAPGAAPPVRARRT